MTPTIRTALKTVAREYAAGQHYHIEYHHAGRTLRPMATVERHGDRQYQTFALIGGAWVAWG